MSQTYNIVHLGLGSFHRAHFAVYMQALMDQKQGQTQDQNQNTWRLMGGNIRNDMAATMQALQAQGGAYTLETVTPKGVRRYQHIHAISQIIAYEPSLQGLLAAAADAQCKIVSFTVTEAGYYLNSDDGLDLGFDDLVRDIAAVKNGTTGSTIYGVMTQILALRLQNGSGAVTLMNCDNLRHNGARFRKGLLAFIELVGNRALLDWVKTHTTCPNAMVDRITPRPKPDVQARVLQATGRTDGAALMAEDFIQWVIEDNFAAPRPAFESVGAHIVRDVAPFEEAKIRILNAAHSCIAWAGTLHGDTYIHEAVARPNVYAWAHHYITDDVIPCLKGLDINLENYRDVVLDRFANPAIEDTNQRVAMDGFSKIPGFIAPTIREALQAGRSISSVAVLPALFLHFLLRWRAGKVPYEYQDQAMDVGVAHAICDSAEPVDELCKNVVLWGDLAGNAALIAAVNQAYTSLKKTFN